MKTYKISLFAGFSDLVKEHGIDYAADLAKKCGFTGVEFFINADSRSKLPSPKDGAEYKRALDARNMAVACVSCSGSLVTPALPEFTHDYTVENLCQCVDFASAVGAPLLHHTLYCRIDRPPEFKYVDAYDAVIEGAQTVAKYAKKKGVKIIYEPQGWFFNGQYGFMKFYREMKSRTDNVGVCFDVGNTYWVDEEPYDLLDCLKNDIVHVHFKDYVLDGEDCGRRTFAGRPIKQVPIGKGQIDIRRIAKALKKFGYDGFFSVEDSTDTAIEEKLRATLDIIK